MKIIITLLTFAFIQTVYSQNLQFRSHLAYSDPLANIGGYVDTALNEYALVGTYYGLDIVDVTNPANPIIKFSVSAAQSDWREVKTYRKFAYVTTEGGGGLTIVDLSNLPAGINSKIYHGDGPIANQLDRIHALHCDTAKAFLYLYGCNNINSGNSVFLDLSDPWNPTYAGEYVFPGTTNDKYVHDGYVLNDTMYEGHLKSGFFSVVDVTNKSNPILLATQLTPTEYTHNTWLSDDHKTLFTTDENSGSYVGVFDISDLANIKEISRFQTSPGSGAIVHNTHILNDYAITSWYKEGVVITDVSRPKNPIEVGKYDSYPQGSGDGFNGCWGVYPYLPSGTIVVSDIDNGLYVLTPTYIRGCYLEGVVTDSLSGVQLSNAKVQILTTTLSDLTDGAGQYQTGVADSGNYNILVSRAGYFSKTITGVHLTNGVLTLLNVELASFPTYVFSGTITDSANHQPIENALVVLETTGLRYTATTNINGNYSFPGIVEDTFDLSVGKWGYRSKCASVTIPQIATFDDSLIEGYYDDFSFDNGWSVNGTSANSWVRGEPIGTWDANNIEINPEYDVTGDCYDKCFVTDNGGPPFSINDVDNGFTVLTSPVFDATIYSNPVLGYFRRYLCVNGQGTPNDTMIIELSNGITSEIVERINPNNPTNGNWVQHSTPIQTVITPTSTMRLVITVGDNVPGNIVEGAFDLFEITGTITTGISENNISAESIQVYPNPFHNELSIAYKVNQIDRDSKIDIEDLTGRIVYEKELNEKEGVLRVSDQLASGMYLLSLHDSNGIIEKKIIKN